MSKKILIVDYTTHHPEVVSALIELFKGHDIRLAATERFAKKYLASDANFAIADMLIKKEKASMREWLTLLAPLFSEQDIVIFSTPIKNQLLEQTLQLSTRGKKVLFLHNVNYFLGCDVLDFATFARLRNAAQPSSAQLLEYFRERVKYWRKQLRLWMQGASFVKLDRLVDFYCFGSDGVAAYFRERSGHANTAILPTNVKQVSKANPLLPPAYRDTLHVAIIGIISPARKDYVAVITALLAARLTRAVTLSLLGACPDPAFAKELAALIRRNTNANLTIHFAPTQQYIPAEQLCRLLGDVHVLLSPIQPDTAYQFHREVYGLSKVSGTEGDCLAHRRPLLLPKSYRCANYIEPLVIHYADTDELVVEINALNDAEALQALYRRVDQVVAGNRYEAFTAAFLQRVGTP